MPRHVEVILSKETLCYREGDEQTTDDNVAMVTIQPAFGERRCLSIKHRSCRYTSQHDLDVDVCLD